MLTDIYQIFSISQNRTPVQAQFCDMLFFLMYHDSIIIIINTWAVLSGSLCPLPSKRYFMINTPRPLRYPREFVRAYGAPKNRYAPREITPESSKKQQTDMMCGTGCATVPLPAPHRINGRSRSRSRKLSAADEKTRRNKPRVDIRSVPVGNFCVPS